MYVLLELHIYIYIIRFLWLHARELVERYE